MGYYVLIGVKDYRRLYLVSGIWIGLCSSIGYYLREILRDSVRYERVPHAKERFRRSWFKQVDISTRTTRSRPPITVLNKFFFLTKTTQDMMCTLNVHNR